MQNLLRNAALQQPLPMATVGMKVCRTTSQEGQPPKNQSTRPGDGCSHCHGMDGVTVQDGATSEDLQSHRHAEQM